MANVTLGQIHPAQGATLGTNRTMLVSGSDGTNLRALKTDAAGEAQVDVLTLPSIPAGANNIGDVDVLTEPGTAADGAVGLPAVVKVVGGYDGANVQAIKTDTVGRPEVVLNGSIPAGVNSIGAVDTELPASAALADAAANPTTPTVGAAALGFNGTSFDRWRNNTEGTLLASAARTGGIISPTQTNYNARGAVVFLNVTAASGTGGLGVFIRGIDPISGNATDFNNAITAITAIGTYAFVVYPGASGTAGSVKLSASAPLTRRWDVLISHSDASSYTYSVSHSSIV